MLGTPRAGAEDGHALAAEPRLENVDAGSAEAVACGLRPAAGLVSRPAAPDAVAALAYRLAPALRDVAGLHLRFERGRRLRSAHRQQVVLVSWSSAALQQGDAQAMVVLDAQAASALRRACVARGMRFVDNV